MVIDKSTESPSMDKKNIPSKYHIEIIFTILFLALVIAWFFRYDVSTINAGNGAGAVVYLNKWTGTVTMVRTYGDVEQLNLNDSH